MAAKVIVRNLSKTETLDVMAVKSPYTVPPMVAGSFDVPPGAGRIVVACAAPVDVEIANVSDQENLATFTDGKEGRLKVSTVEKVSIPLGGRFEIGIPQ